MLTVSQTLLRGSPYALLGLCETGGVTVPELKKAFRLHAARLHPDAGGDPEDFRRLRRAYETLLQRHGGGGHPKSPITGDHKDGWDRGETDSSGRGFYDSPHAQYDPWTAQERRRQHYDATSSPPRHGEGLGEDYSAAAGWDTARGRWRNFSTQDFYRPYTSDFTDPYGHGFTPEEVREAENLNRRLRRRALAKHALLWGGLLVVCAQYRLNDRVARGERARADGYADPAYWTEVDRERQRGPPLRLQDPWWERPLGVPSLGESAGAGDGAGGGGPRARQEAAGRALARPASTAPRVLRFRHRPFTPSGVRSPRANLPKDPRALVSDISFDLDDLDDEV